MEKKPGVLIVDDRPANRHMLARALSTLDVQIHEAESGEQALAIASKEPELFVALVDVRMPGMDGFQLAERLRQVPEASSLPIIFITALGSDSYYHQRAYETGAVDFLSKPVSPRVLLSKVSVFLDLFRNQSQLKGLIRRLDTVNAALSKQTLRLETAAEVMHQIASILDLDELLMRVLSLTRERFGYDFAGIWLRDDESDGIVLRAGQYGTPTPVREPGAAIALNAPKSIIAHVCRTGVTYLTNDTSADEHYLATDELPPMGSELTLPLKFRDTLFGAVDLQSEAPNAFSPEDVVALKTLADQISVAIRNARLYAEVRRLNEDLEAKVEARTNELATAYHHLELLDRNKSDFITVVSHELRTPLTLISGFSRVLLEDPAIESDTERWQEVQGIVTGADRMRAIIDSMLDMLKIDSRSLRLKPLRISLIDMLAEIKHRLSPTLEERDLGLALEGLEALPEIEADPSALDKVFYELLSNAIKYTPDGGQITISGEPVPSRDEGSDGYVSVVVGDTGIGVDPEVQELIFTKFYRTGEVTFHSSSKTRFKGGGPGLGLSIARGLVEAHGGRIWVESPGCDEEKLPGSDFHVLLPVSQPHSGKPALPA
ncbi:MAG: response regulator [Anaerolineae bacterium]